MEFNKLLKDLSHWLVGLRWNGMELLTCLNLERTEIELVLLQILSFVRVQIVEFIKLPI